MDTLETLRSRFPEAAKDTKLNLQSVIDGESSLSGEQKLEVALGAAITAQSQELAKALIERAKATLPNADAILDDAFAAATLMAMNNVYYRFRHQVGKESYSKRSPRLRMNRLGQVKAKKADFELACLAISAMNACEDCIRAHEKAVLDAGLSEDHVHDAIRIAATIKAATIALDIHRLSA